MNLSAVETDFLILLRRDITQELDIERNEYGILAVSLMSPCGDIGKLTAYVEDEEVTLSCNISHVHGSIGDMKRRGKSDPCQAMLKEASAKFVDLIQERAFLSKTTAPNGMVICTGWGPIESINERNERFYKALVQQYGEPIVTEHWLWSGKMGPKL